MTPALLRYKQLKSEKPQCVLLYRMGDFYEAFYDDAILISRVLDIALTSRDKTQAKTPMAGIPYHALETYLAKLIDAGYKVAIAEQYEEKQKDIKTNKEKIVINRNIERIVTPSTYDEESSVNARFLVSVIFEKENIALACIDPNGSTFWVQVLDSTQDLDNELYRIMPSEILLTESQQEKALSSNYISKNLQLITPISKSLLSSENILKHFNLSSLKSFGLENEIEIQATSACFNYLTQLQYKTLSHINLIEKRIKSNLMHIDSNTLRNLEIVTSTNNSQITLLNILDQTKTRAGKRLFRDRLTTPLKDIKEIQERINAVKFFVSQDTALLCNLLEQIYDLERVCARISYESASPRDLVSLAKSINLVFENKNLFENKEIKSNKINNLYKNITTLSKNLNSYAQNILNTFLNPAPAHIKDGNFIKENVSKELDELKNLSQDSSKWLKNFAIMEQQKTKINNLKVKYNRVFGYFIEVSKSHINKIPDNYIRKQTTVNGERYITPELKEKENIILNAKDKILELELEIYKNILKESKKEIEDILKLQKNIAELDVYISCANVANLYNYYEPVFTKKDISIVDARHPVAERIITENYIYNDVTIKENEILLITGPNMGGKSTYIRMTALICYMAHVGMFVPAKECRLPVVDGIFTRVGASDNLASGESTFMVEMTETASILRNATKDSLVILDEIGRGTSTYDGLSLAWAIVEYIHENIKAKTLFATHYHELTVLENNLKNFSNFTVGIAEEDEEIVFLRKIQKGKAEKSFGIHVAKLAGLPESVLNNANKILAKLETGDSKKDSIAIDRQMALWEFATATPFRPKGAQLQDSLLAEIKDLDLNNMTPLEVVDKIAKIKQNLEKL